MEPDQSSTETVEVADIFRIHWQDYCRGRLVTSFQHKVARAIMDCRTAALGGHRYQCDSCGHQQNRYNSCRNRHCPKCQGHKAAQWVEERRAELLPVQYFHTVFTLPHELNELVLMNKSLMYELLFKAASRTLLQVGRNNLKCELGFFSLLHSWGQTLTLHPHLHVVIPGCGIKGDKVTHFKKRYFVSDRILSAVFRGKFVSLLKKARRAGKLRGDFDDFEAFIDRVVKSKWVVRTKPPFAGPEVVLKYLARYTQRVAIGNSRIIALKDGNVSFSYKDYRTNEKKLMTLPATEFIRRFMLHLLPSKFVRVRYYGFLTRAKKQLALAIIRAVRTPAFSLKPATTPHRSCCRECKSGILVLIGEIPRVPTLAHDPPAQLMPLS